MEEADDNRSGTSWSRSTWRSSSRQSPTVLCVGEPFDEPRRDRPDECQRGRFLPAKDPQLLGADLPGASASTHLRGLEHQDLGEHDERFP
jgi:hypothetical protein